MLVCVSVKKSDNRGVYLQECSSGPDKWPAQTVHQQVQSGMTTPYRQTHTLMHSHTNAMNTTSIASLLLQVRSKAQNVLFTALGTYNFCCRDIIPAVLEYLDPDRTDVTQQQFKVGLTLFTMTKPCKKKSNSLFSFCWYAAAMRYWIRSCLICLCYSSPGCLVLSVREPLWDLSCYPAVLGVHCSDMACHCAFWHEPLHVSREAFNRAALRWPGLQGPSPVRDHRSWLFCEFSK